MLFGAGELANDDDKLIPIIARMGGKTKLADKIIKLFPPDEFIKTYVELFIGGNSIFFKKKEAKINVINDLDKDIYNIYNDIKKVDNIDNFDFTPNKNKFNRLLNTNYKNSKDRLYRNLYLSKQSFMGSRRSFSNRHVGINVGINLKKNIKKYNEKLLNTTILNKDYKDVIKKYNKKDTLFYLDPPYSEQKKHWGYNEGETITPEELLEQLKTIKGYFLMSYDYSPELKRFFEKDFIVKTIFTMYQTKTFPFKKKEMIIMNYEFK
jgi:DNA adenine methylase